MAEIVFTCPSCGVEMETDESFAGDAAQCPNCNNTVLIPMPGIKEGMELGGFQVEKRLGIGGMGEVWLATQTSMDRQVALKILSPALTQDSDFVSRFMEEVKTSAKLDHPNIVSAHHAGVENGIHFLAMTYVDGAELDDKMKVDKIIDEKEALKIVRSIAEALGYAWDRFKIIHRDIKPSNIMIDSYGTAKLMDMGISKSMSEDKNLTMTGMIVGTPYYMSPEQAKADSVLDARSDIYALGATLYHMVTGEVPYEATTAMGILAKHITDEFPSPQLKNPELSDECSVLLEIMMSKKPEQRQPDWKAVIADIDRVLAGEFPLTPRPGVGKSQVMQMTASQALSRRKVIKKPPKAKRSGKGEEVSGKGEAEGTTSKKPLIIGVAATVLVLLIVGGIFLSSGQKGDDSTSPIGLTQEPSEPVSQLTGEPVKTNVKTPEDLHKALKAANPDYNGKGMFRVEGGKIVGVELYKSPNVSDINCLKGLPLIRINLANTKISDISPLKGMRLEVVSLGNKIDDISVLKGMPLISVIINGNKQIKDITPLKGTKLVQLGLEGCENINDFSVIKGMPLNGFWTSCTGFNDDAIKLLKGMKLEKLYLGNTKVSDISVLSGMPLKHLRILDCENLKDLTPLKNCHSLENLSFTPKYVSKESIKTLKDMKSLKYIGGNQQEQYKTNQPTATEFWKRYDAGKYAKPIQTSGAVLTPDCTVDQLKAALKKDNPGYDGSGDFLINKSDGKISFLKSHDKNISNIHALTGLNLKSLFLGGSSVSDISPLKGMPLDCLEISGTEVTDISPLKGMKLTALYIQETKISDISVLAGMPLTYLVIFKTPITDVSALKGMKLEKLSASNTKIKDINPLKGMPLKELALGWAPVRDISALKGMPLKELRIQETEVKDLSPLAGMKLEKLCFTPQNITKGIDVLRGMNLLNLLAGSFKELCDKQSAAEFWKKYDAGKYGKPLIAKSGDVAKPISKDGVAGMWQYAKDYAKKNPQKTSLIIAKYEEVKKAAAGTKYQMMADDEIRKLKGVLEQKNKIINNVVPLLLSRKFRTAYKRFNASSEKASMPELKKILGELSHTDRIVLESFKKDIGKSVRLETTRGKQTVKIKKIKGRSVYIELKAGKATIQKKLSMRSLSSGEKFRRLDAMSKPAKAIYTGVYAARKKQFDVAGKCFKQAGVLSDSLLEQLAKNRLGKAELQARNDLLKIIHKVRVRDSSLNPEKIKDELKKRKFTEKQFKDLEKSVAGYRQKYAKSTFAKEHDNALTVLLETVKKAVPNDFNRPWMVKNPKIELVPIKPGSFMMGLEGTKKHKVILTKPFWMGKYEVTQKQYEKIMGENISKYKDPGKSLPVEKVHWNRATEFCRRLNEKECKHIPKTYVFRLPTEAEWEYCCRAGTNTQYSFGDSEGDLCKYGNYKDKSSDMEGSDKNHDDGFKHTAPVGSYKPNPWGLYDMHGNVWEWCYDRWARDYPKGVVTDPIGAPEGENRIFRGGCWKIPQQFSRSAQRNCLGQSSADDTNGFRIVLAPEIRQSSSSTKVTEFTGKIKIPEDLHKALKASNPQYNGKGIFRVEGGKIIGIDLHNCPTVNDVSCLKRLSSLQYITIWGTKVSDISSLKNLKLEKIYLPQYVSDISAVKNMPLTEFCVQGGNETQLKDLSPLKKLKLTHLWLGYCQEVSDISMIKNFRLEGLVINGCKNIKDFSVLKGQPLKTISLDNTQFSNNDMKLLKGMKLEHITLLGTGISDISVLAGMPLKSLRIFTCRNLKDLSPLKKCRKLEKIILEPKYVSPKSMEILRKMKQLKYIAGHPGESKQSATEFWKKYDAGKYK